MAVRFDASGEEYTRALSLGATSQFSVSCWFKMSVDRSPQTSSVWSIDDGNSSGFDNAYLGVDGTTLHFHEPSANVWGARTLTVGTWYYAGVSVNGANGTMITRALGDSTFALTTWTDGDTSIIAANFRIGRSVYTSGWLNGAVAAVKLWTGTLTREELENEAFFYLPRRTNGLAAWYPLLTPETVDYSGNARTLSGGSGTTAEDGPAISWAPQRKRFVIAPVAPTPIALTDSATVTDNLAVTAGVPLAETVTATDALAVQGTVTLTEQVTVTDALTVTVATALAETVTVTDALTAGMPVALTEAVTVTDTMAVTAGVTVAETATVTDALGVTAQTVLADTVTVTDALNVVVIEDITVAAGAPASRWAAGEPVTAWTAGEPVRGWSAGEPRT